MSLNDQPKRKEWPTKGGLRFCAAISIIAAGSVLCYCAKVYLKGNFLEPGITLNSQTVEDLKEVIRLTTFGSMPGLALLLILNSIYLWACSRKSNSKLETNSVTSLN